MTMLQGVLQRAVEWGRVPTNDLRHAFASLLIHEGGLSVVEIAAQLGQNPTVCLDTYAHVMAEREGGERVGVEEQIVTARRVLERGRSEPSGIQLDLFAPQS